MEIRIKNLTTYIKPIHIDSKRCKMQDKILLGFLLKGNKTGYQVKKEMEGSTNFFFNTSMGSTNPAFKKLEKNQMVTSKDVIENGRLKKIYSITEKGKEYFNNWMNSEIVIPKIKNEMLLRVFFFSHIKQNEKEKILKDYISTTEEKIEKLNRIKKIIGINNIREGEFASLNYGIDYYTFIKNWYQTYLEQISKGDK